MNQSGTSLATRRALEPGVPLPHRRSVRTRRQELEIKLATLQKDYAELHTAIFEAAQVHRRLCAPRLVRYGNFEIASEIFAVRHLPGDFFTIEETNSGVLLALGGTPEEVSWRTWIRPPPAGCLLEASLSLHV